MDPRLRIGATEREWAMAELARHYADGRLDHDELDERLDAVGTAKTSGDLAVLFSDLPRPAPPAPPARLQRPRHRSGRWVPILALLIFLSVLTHLPFWLLIFPVVFATTGVRQNRPSTCFGPRRLR